MPVYEWHVRKAAQNLRKHGVGFEFSVLALQDPFGIAWIDERKDYGEIRNVLLGMASGTILTVVYTERGETIRIISARRATRYEQDLYYRQNQA